MTISFGFLPFACCFGNHPPISFPSSEIDSSFPSQQPIPSLSLRPSSYVCILTRRHLRYPHRQHRDMFSTRRSLRHPLSLVFTRICLNSHCFSVTHFIFAYTHLQSNRRHRSFCSHSLPPALLHICISRRALPHRRCCCRRCRCCLVFVG